MNSRIVTINDEELIREYKYELTECEYKGIICFGISIKRSDFKNDIIVQEVKDEVKLITPDRKKVGVLMNELADKVVSPIHLIDIIGEYVDNCIEDFKNVEEAILVN